MPTDIEGVFECNSHFLYLEFKTEGADMPSAQRLMYERRLLQDRKFGCLFLVTHDRVSQSVKFPSEIRGLQIHRYDEQAKALATSPQLVVDSEVVGWWVKNWIDHAEAKPNSFITTFRRHAGIYPGQPDPCSFA